jgi:hypothetical protein
MSQEKFEKVVQLLKDLMEEHHVPGVAVGFAVDGQTYSAGLGVTSVDNPVLSKNQSTGKISAMQPLGSNPV